MATSITEELLEVLLRSQAVASASASAAGSGSGSGSGGSGGGGNTINDEHLQADDDDDDQKRGHSGKNERERIVIDWDDGFIPSGCNGKKCKMVTIDDQKRSQRQSSRRSRRRSASTLTETETESFKSDSNDDNGFVAVIDNAITTKTANDIYNNAIQNKNNQSVWGEYIKLSDIDNTILLQGGEGGETEDVVDDQHRQRQRQLQLQRRRFLAASAVKELFFNNKQVYNLLKDDLTSTTTSTTSNNNTDTNTNTNTDIRKDKDEGTKESDKDNEDVHGISVWVIVSNVNDSVQYHIDYAEMFRYQTNIIYPPMYGSTLQISPINMDTTTSNSKSNNNSSSNDNNNNNPAQTRTTRATQMKGGDFYVNKKGLNHYSKYKYKCKLNQLDIDIDLDDDDKVKEENTTNTNTNGDGSGWIKVPYKYNRATICDGNLPHFSSPVTSITTTPTTQSEKEKEKDEEEGLIIDRTKGDDAKAKDNDIDIYQVVKRVIVGFNVCNNEIGPIVEQYPEHSSKFNKYIKIYQATNKIDKNNNNNNNNNNNGNGSKGNSNSEKCKDGKGGKGGGFSIEDAKRNPKIASFIISLAKKYKENNMNI